ncbi:MAG: hypothetical protein PUB07_00685, partial [Clostridia bacterium]|nr:hypothetical protein [Clostridia bacterium]
FFTGTRDGSATEALNSNLAVLPKSGYVKIEFYFNVPADAIAKDKVLNFSSRQKGSLLDNISVKKVSDYNFEHTAVTTTDAGKEITISYYSNPSATAATDASVPTVLVCLYNNASNLTLTAIDTVVVTKNIEKKLVEGTTAALYTVSTVYVDMGSKAVQIPTAANTIKLMAWTNTTSIIPLRSATEITIQ